MQALTEWLPLALCVGALVLWSRFIHVRNRDAGNGWRYIYWQPWRVLVIGIVLAVFVGYMAVITVLARSVMPI